MPPSQPNGEAAAAQERAPGPAGEEGRRSRWRASLLGVGLPLLVSAAFIAWIVRDVDDPRLLLASLDRAAWLPLALVIPFDLLSHYVRALRWRRFIGAPVPSYLAFSSLLIGYAVNGVIPRGGEVARLINMQKMTGVPFARLLATLVAERLLDVLSLLLLIGLSILAAGPYLTGAFPGLVRVAPVGIAAVVVGFAAMFFVARYPEGVSRFAARAGGRIHAKVGVALERLVRQGAEGLAFLRSGRAVCATLLETIGVWFFLWLAFLSGLIAFRILGEVGLAGSAVTFSITSASAIVPSAGAIGAFHKFGRDSLAVLYRVDGDVALAFATALHMIAYYVVPLGGGLLAWIGQLVFFRPQKQT